MKFDVKDKTKKQVTINLTLEEASAFARANFYINNIDMLDFSRIEIESDYPDDYSFLYCFLSAFKSFCRESLEKEGVDPEKYYAPWGPFRSID